MIRNRIAALVIALTTAMTTVQAQIAQHRNIFSIGINGGYIMSNVAFNPKVTQSMHGGMTGGLSIRYTSEKYYKTLCSLYAEINYASIGWKDRIEDALGNAVINPVTNQPEQYQRDISYIQVPLMAHLSWGKERRGCQFFFRAGPQFGLMLSEKTKKNFDLASRNMADRANTIVEQDAMPVEHKFDYGIAVGLGIEWNLHNAGHLLAEARYYYGLGNIYGDSKSDYFGNSNFNNIIFKVAYMIDLTK